jgi:phage baseplate assembly protein W
MANFLGAPYPITKQPLGLLFTQSGVDQIKSDLLILLYSNFGERVMLPEFGIALKSLFFEPNDEIVKVQAREIIAEAIEQWEPRVVISDILITTNSAEISTLDPTDITENEGHILGILIKFFDPEDINSVQELKLEVPLD